jgi:hypothetical protein
MEHPSSSAVQQATEPALLEKAEQHLGVRFSDIPPCLHGLKLDGFADGDMPVCVEVFARVGPCKAGQKRKLSRDMTKLLLAERRLGKPCRKVIVVLDTAAVGHLTDGWDGEFAREFEIELLVVEFGEAIRNAVQAAQERQRR